MRASQRARGDDAGLVDAVLAADERRRAALAEFEPLRAEQKALGKQVAAGAGEERQALLRRAKELADAGQGRCRPTRTPRRASSTARRGGSPTWSRRARRPAARTTTSCSARSAARATSPPRLRAARPPGAGRAARRHRHRARREGLRRPVLLPHRRRRAAAARPAQLRDGRRRSTTGFTPMITPTLVKPEVDGGHRLPRRARREVYRLEADDLYLVGTSEVPLAGVPRRRDPGPVRRARCGYAGWSACFRREAGSYGKDTRGIIRVHQFDKVEMFVYCRPEEAADEHRRLLAWEEEMLAKVEVPYRVIDVAAGDLGLQRRPQVRLRGVGAHAGPLPRADLDVELHHLPGPPAGRPLPRRRRQSRSPSPRSTARSRRPAGSSPCWRTTSSRTARCGCRRRCGPTSAASTSSSAP